MINGLVKCKGAHKRFEYKGEKDGITVIDDYAHHPTEIKATLNTAKKIKHNKTYCVFQPHTYTRTKTLFDEFTHAFEGADELLLMDIYAAREKDTGLVSSDELGDAIRKTGLKCINVHSHDEAANYLKNNAKEGDLILTVGAGDVVIVGDIYIKHIKKTYASNKYENTCIIYIKIYKLNNITLKLYILSLCLQIIVLF